MFYLINYSWFPLDLRLDKGPANYWGFVMKFMGFLIILGLLLTACGNMKGQTGLNANNNNSLNLQSLNLNGNISGGVHDETPAISYDPEKQKVKLSLPLTGGAFLDPTAENLPIEGLNGSTIAIVDPQTGVTTLELEIPLGLIQQVPSGLPTSNTLPNEQEIPTFQEGQYSYAEMLIDEESETQVRIYASNGHIGLYMSSPINPYVSLSYPVLNSDNQILGYLSQVPAVGHHPGGFFLSLILSGESL